MKFYHLKVKINFKNKIYKMIYIKDNKDKINFQNIKMVKKLIKFINFRVAQMKIQNIFNNISYHKEVQKS